VPFLINSTFPPTDAWMLLSPLTLLLGVASATSQAWAAGAEPTSNNADIYEESLVFRPLADGKLSVLFRFHTKAHDGTSSPISLLDLLTLELVFHSTGAS
jgi:hypothetical protein